MLLIPAILSLAICQLRTGKNIVDFSLFQKLPSANLAYIALCKHQQLHEVHSKVRYVCMCVQMKVVIVCAHTYESNCVSDVNAVFAQSKFHTFPIDSIRVSRSSNSQLDALCKGKQAQGERGGRGG